MSSDEDSINFLRSYQLTDIDNIDLDNTTSPYLSEDNRMSDSEDSDKLPDLVDSTDEESDTPPVLSNSQIADLWLKKRETFRNRQEDSMRIFALGPFLLALKDMLPAPWMAFLRKSGLMRNKERENELTSLSWVEWSIVDLVDDVISVMFKKLKKKPYLVTSMNTVDSLERLEVQEFTLENSWHQVSHDRLYMKLWMKVLRLSSSKTLEIEAKCAIMYICKIYHTFVVGLIRDGRDMVEEKKKQFRCKDPQDPKIPMKLKDAGNEQYQHGKFETAIDYYTKAAKADPFNHIYFGNRAQAYSRLKKYREALADGRRAVTLKPDWPKGHYRYAQAFYELGKLPEAIYINRKGLEICRTNKMSSDSNMRDLEQQGQKFRQSREAERIDRKISKIIQETDFDKMDEIIPNLPDGSHDKHVINLTKPVSLSDDTETEDDVPPLCDSSSDEDLPDLVQEDDHKFPPPKKELVDKIKRQGEKQQAKASKSQQQSSSVHELEISAKKSSQTASGDLTTKPNKDKVEKKEEEKPQPPPEHPEILEFKQSLSDGYTASQKGMSTKAARSYSRALELTSQYGQKHFELDNKSIVSLKYVYGSMAVETGILKNIMDGMDKFNDIIKSHDDKRFPLAYYGIGKAYIALNRNKEAVDTLKKALKITNNNKLTSLCWPGTSVKVEESVHHPFVKLLEHLMLSSRHPSPPDAKCRFHRDDEDNRSWIYLSDPDFKGLVRIFCHERCLIEFHNHCWKVYKCKFGDLDKIADKEMLETRCPTPECTAYIIKVLIIRQDTTVKEIVSDKKHPKTKTRSPYSCVKTPASSLYKIERKREKKEWRKKKRQEAREERDDLSEENERATEDIDSQLSQENQDVTMETAGVKNSVEVAEIDKVNLENASVFRREEEDNLDKYKATKKQKTKKKKEKERVKQVIAVDFNFTDDKQLVNEHTQEEEEEEEERKRSQKYSQQSFSVPSSLENSLQAFERSYTKPTVKLDEISLNLFSFFEDLLLAHGPLHADDIKITSMLEDFPPDAKDRIDKAGGLCKFLRQSVHIKFAMIDDVVCLLKDAAKARDISRNQSNPMLRDVMKSNNVWEKLKSDNMKFVAQRITEKPEITKSVVSKQEEKKSDFVKSSGIDSLDDFSLTSRVKYSKKEFKVDTSSEVTAESSHSRMDCLDDVTYPKTKISQSLDSLDDKYVSDSESNKDGSITSDWDSISCRSEDMNKPVVDEKINNSRSKLDDFASCTKLPETRQSDNISRSSSRSDVNSDKSDISGENLSKFNNKNGILKCDQNSVESIMKGAYNAQGGSVIKWPPSTEEFMSKAYKAQDNSPWSSQQAPVTVPPVPASWNSAKPLQDETKTVNRGFGPIGSPVCSNFTEDNVLYKPKPTSRFSTLADEISEATMNQKKEIDQKLVSELADEVMSQMFDKHNKVSESDKREAYQRVTRDIWEDFNKCANPRSSPSVDTSNSCNNWWTSPSSEWASAQNSKQSFAEQFMKSHYQKDKNISKNSNVIEKTSGFPSQSLPIPAETNMNATNGVSIGNSIWSNSNGTQTSSYTYSPVPPPLAMPTQRTAIGGLSIWSPPTSSSVPFLSQPPQFINKLAPPASSPLYNNNNSVQKNVMSTAVQVTMETQCVSTNTEPFINYEEKYVLVRKEREEIERNFQSATQQIKELSQLLQEKHEHCKMLELNQQQRQQQLESLVQMFKEKEHEFNRRQADFVQSQQRCQELEKRCSEAEKMLSEIELSRNQERELKERAVSNANEFRVSMETEVERAKSAEIEILREQQKNAMKMLTRSQKEAQYHMHRLSALMKKCQEEKQPLPVHIQQTMDHYQNINRKCEEVIKRLEFEFEEHVQHIQNGKKLSQLPQIHVPPPPPPPPMPALALQAPMANNISHRALPPSVTQSRASEPLSMPSLHDREDTDKAAMKMLELQPPPKPLVPPSQQPKPLAPPPGVQPKPLAPPSGTLGHLPPRPLIGSRPPLIGTAVRPAARLSQPTHIPKNCFEKLLERLQIVFPKYNRAVFTSLIQQLRQNKGGSLSGTTLDEIVQHISELITSMEKTEPVKPNQTSRIAVEPPKPIAPPPGLGGSWGFAASASDNSAQGELFEEVEDPCVICYEEMKPSTITVLDCGHVFHDACIRKWLHEQSTCPNCRKHALMPDEFPALK